MYKKIVFIGDIHGCYDTLKQYPDFKDGLKDDTEYIFLGDYIDRGNQNAEVLQFLDQIKDLLYQFQEMIKIIINQKMKKAL